MWKDLTGKRFRKLLVVGKTADDRCSWNCVCDCGNLFITTSTRLGSGNTKSCGCLKRDVTILRNTTHGMSKYPEYSHWKDMNKRCFQENKRRVHYADRGISVHKDFIKDFPTWLREIGRKPTIPGRWSVGRKDNNGWYTYDNMRWELPPQQARNHTKQINNTSGITGVKQQVKVIAGRTYTSQVACWIDNGKKRTKNFSEDKYGSAAAKSMAIAFREARILEMNNNGADYALSHGSDK